MKRESAGKTQSSTSSICFTARQHIQLMATVCGPLRAALLGSCHTVKCENSKNSSRCSSY